MDPIYDRVLRSCTPDNWNKNVCRQLKMLLDAYSRERNPHETPDIDDKIAECSGDELGETVSSNGEPADMTADCSGDEQVIMKKDDDVDTPRPPEQDVVKKVPRYTGKNQKHTETDLKEQSFSDTDDYDDELQELIEKKKRLEREKETLSDAKLRRKAEREKIKAKLQNDVKTLESEVAQLAMKYKDARR